jgi:DNA topoisomerase-1
MMKRWSKNGWFLGCSNYPKCKNTQDLGPQGDGTGVVGPRVTDEACDKCGKPMAVRTGRYGEFLSCTGYPACKNARPVPLGVKCPKCGGDVIEVKSRKKGGRSFYGCSRYASETKCDFRLWQRPVPEPCPSCGAPFLTKTAGKKPQLACVAEGCGYKHAVEEAKPETDELQAAPPP